jgi:hypothetical protein
MKLTKQLLIQLVQEEVRSMASSYGGTFGKIHDADLLARLNDLRDQIGDSEFVEELINQASGDILSNLVRRVAKSKGLTIGGVKYI